MHGSNGIPNGVVKGREIFVQLNFKLMDEYKAEVLRTPETSLFVTDILITLHRGANGSG
jgi:hypothetical protein